MSINLGRLSVHLVTDSHDYSEINRTTLHTGLYAISTCIDTIFPESHGTENKKKHCRAKRVRKIHRDKNCKTNH